MADYDVVLLTQKEYINPSKVDDYVNNVLKEDRIVSQALEACGLKVKRIGWDDPDFDWSSTKCVLIRAVWDYFNRFDEFKSHLNKIAQKTSIINPPELIWWNIDKHYLRDLNNNGINIVPTTFIEPTIDFNLALLFETSGYNKAVIKPVVSGAAKLTFVVEQDNILEVEKRIKPYTKNEAFMLQPFIDSIIPKGEVSHMIFNGEYTHSVLKKAKPGDFRVQDDFGGTVHEYQADADEKAFAISVVNECKVKPIYARVDVVWDNNGKLAVAELEIIEPELWFREKPQAATILAQGIHEMIR